MRGLVLAAGPGRRLHPLTEALPKTLLSLGEGRTILDLVLENLRSVGMVEAAVVTGFAAERIAEQVPALERRHGLRLELIFNERAERWNNAYSLWLARDAFREGVLLVNGDTVHPSSVEEKLLAARGPEVLLGVDQEKPLGEEEMKVLLADNGAVCRIGKDVDGSAADGEYMGVALIEPRAAEPLSDALEATWRRDPSLYYEDAWQEFIDRGRNVHAVPIGAVDWVEVDHDGDLERARDIQCRY